MCTVLPHVSTHAAAFLVSRHRDCVPDRPASFLPRPATVPTCVHCIPTRQHPHSGTVGPCTVPCRRLFLFCPITVPIPPRRNSVPFRPHGHPLAIMTAQRCIRHDCFCFLFLCDGSDPVALLPMHLQTTCWISSKKHLLKGDKYNTNTNRQYRHSLLPNVLLRAPRQSTHVQHVASEPCRQRERQLF